MNYKKFLESKLGSFLGKSRIVRVLIMKLWIRQQKRKGIADAEEYIKMGSLK